ncbi:dethiobiotin synthetase [Saccharothrix tamanrassetensis]|uniref:ATP-dependent dethiobiotin synthetase BioD n=1 Tax=Saccharothrix tamanrassetensis TaxID=1051531 RepID=A0A841CFK1_9PSEU|nr:dethiobiotin synthase [Saccharothrix tamanrassetensis]MBB5955753.1 dethiobiotin synthetase [Saccharothrix tamanrassetensis]
MSVLVITGTGTEVGKTVVVAALAALAVADGRRVAVLKPAQTGIAADEPGDLSEVIRLAGPVTTRELRRYPDPLAPATAARRSGRPTVHPSEMAAAAVDLDRTHDLVLVEGAGGLLVRFDDEGTTIADAAWALNAPVLVVAHAGLGTLNMTALTAEALLHRGLESVGVVVGRWPAEPDLAARCNLVDLPEAAGGPLLGVLPDGAARLSRADFLDTARAALSPWFGGTFDPEKFAAPHTC